MTGVSNVVQTANQLAPDTWSDETGFTAMSDSTNLSLSTTQQFFRVVIP